MDSYSAKDRFDYERIVYDDDSYLTIDHDRENKDSATIEQKYHGPQADARTYKNTTYDLDTPRVVEEHWVPLDNDEAVDPRYGQWKQSYKETWGGTIVRHWYLDDYGQYHFLDEQDDSDNLHDSSGWDHEPGDPNTSDDGGWGGYDGAHDYPITGPLRQLVQMSLQVDDLRHLA